jgi:hypothetical protein
LCRGVVCSVVHGQRPCDHACPALPCAKRRPSCLLCCAGTAILHWDRDDCGHLLGSAVHRGLHGELAGQLGLWAGGTPNPSGLGDTQSLWAGGHSIPLGWGTLNPSGLGDTQSLWAGGTPNPSPLHSPPPRLPPHCPSPQLQVRAHPIPARLASHLTPPHPTTIPACRTLNARTAVIVFRRVSQP